MNLAGAVGFNGHMIALADVGAGTCEASQVGRDEDGMRSLLLPRGGRRWRWRRRGRGRAGDARWPADAEAALDPPAGLGGEPLTHGLAALVEGEKLCDGALEDGAEGHGLGHGDAPSDKRPGLSVAAEEGLALDALELAEGGQLAGLVGFAGLGDGPGHRPGLGGGGGAARFGSGAAHDCQVVGWLVGYTLTEGPQRPFQLPEIVEILVAL